MSAAGTRTSFVPLVDDVDDADNVHQGVVFQESPGWLSRQLPVIRRGRGLVLVVALVAVTLALMAAAVFFSVAGQGAKNESKSSSPAAVVGPSSSTTTTTTTTTTTKTSTTQRAKTTPTTAPSTTIASTTTPSCIGNTGNDTGTYQPELMVFTADRTHVRAHYVKDNCTREALRLDLGNIQQLFGTSYDEYSSCVFFTLLLQTNDAPRSSRTSNRKLCRDADDADVWRMQPVHAYETPELANRSDHTLTVDWAGRNLVWLHKEHTDGQYHLVVAKMEGSAYKTIPVNARMPIDVKMDPVEAFVFWTDWREFAGSPGIVRYDLQGKENNEKSIFQKRDFFVSKITLDLQNTRLYMFNLLDSHISSMDYDGREYTRHTVLPLNHHLRSMVKDTDHLVWSVTVDSNKVFWADLDGDEHAASKYKSHRVAYSEEVTEFAVITSGQQTQPDDNPCLNADICPEGVCRPNRPLTTSLLGYLCWPSNDVPSPPEDGPTTTPTSTTATPNTTGKPGTCGALEFSCKEKLAGRILCVPETWVCDGEKDCLDGSDEDPDTCKKKQNQRCALEFFSCGAHCIPISWVCDGALDCLDGSDEERC